jgi:AhpD family alkylhydroperoxidase
LLTRLVFWIARRRFGRVPEPLRITAHNRWVLAAACGYEAFLPNARALDERAKDLVNLLVAMRIGCPFCVDIGSAIARSHGLTADDVTELRGWRSSARFTARERLMFEYAEAMTTAPVEITEALFGALEQALGPAGLVELSAVVAWENYRSRFNVSFDAQAEGYSEGAFCAIAPRPILPPSATASTGHG